MYIAVNGCILREKNNEKYSKQIRNEIPAIVRQRFYKLVTRFRDKNTWSKSIRTGLGTLKGLRYPCHPKKRSSSKIVVHTPITGDPSKQDLRWTQKPIYSSIFTNNIWFYLLSSSVIANTPIVAGVRWRLNPLLKSGAIGHGYGKRLTPFYTNGV